MKRWIALPGIVILGITSVVVNEHRKVDGPVGPAALLYLVADTEQELMRMPVSFTRMSDADEIAMGNEIARSYTPSGEQEKTLEATVVERYLTQVGSQLASHAHRKLPYRFHYIPEMYFANAFALPGGHVYVGAGLMSHMDSEDELAAVIGHELEHIDHYHCAQRAQQEQALHKIPLGELVAFPIEVFEAGYSKDQELEADREGTRLAVETGYSATGAIRIFETLERMYGDHPTKAKTPQQEVSRVALETLEGYFRSHPLPSERIAQVQTMIAANGWAARPERDLAVEYIFLAAKAQQQLDAHSYAQAEELAKQSLRRDPNQQEALEVLARAQFAQANFSGAAAAYQKMLERETPDQGIIAAYAQALAAADRGKAILEFRRWGATVDGRLAKELEVVEAGHALLTGNAEASHKLEIELNLDSDTQSPLWIGELGWWHYWAGDYQTAAKLLSAGLQQRPGYERFRLQLAWTQIELRRYEDALALLRGQAYRKQLQPETAMARAVADWQAQEPDEALRYFAFAVNDQPEWENSSWVKALYSPLVAQSIEEMDVEHQKQKARLTAAR